MTKQPRIFMNEHVRNGMLNLRKRGYTLESLGTIYNVDFSSIYHHCSKAHIKVKNKVEFNLPHIISRFIINPLDIVTMIVPVRRGIIENGYATGKSYKEYLEEDRKRHNPKLFRILDSI